jgi:hypothetical protein
MLEVPSGEIEVDINIAESKTYKTSIGSSNDFFPAIPPSKSVTLSGREDRTPCPSNDEVNWTGE